MGDLKSRYTHKFAFLLSDGRGGHNQVDADSQEHDDESSPGDKSVAAQLVGLARLGPGVRGVDRGVFVNVRLAVADAQGVDVASLAVASLRGGTGFGGALVADTGLATLGFGTL